MSLGLSNSSPKPRSRHHKSLSTTSITKSSVISSYQQSPLTEKPVTVVTPPTTILSASVMDWGQNSEDSTSDDHSSVSSNILASVSDDSSVSSVNSSNTNNPKNYSAAMDALVNASLLPTKRVVIISNEFDNMPPVSLLNRRQDTEPVITVKIAEMVKKKKTPFKP